MGLKLVALLVVCGWSAGRRVRIRSAVVRTRGGSVAEIGAISGACNTGVAVFGPATRVVAGRGSNIAACNGRGRAPLRTDDRVVKNSTSPALPIVNKALADLPDSHANAIGCALNFDDAFRRLREHVLLRDHAYVRNVLDMLDLETAAADDCSHLVVRDEELDGW